MMEGALYKYPITFEIVGVKNKLIGIKCVLYDLNLNHESGCFLHVREGRWLF